MPSEKEILEAIKALVFTKKTIVSCPANPMPIPGIGAGSAYTAGEVMGTIITLPVPKSGVIYSATLWDLDDEALQIDLEIFKRSIAQIADNNTWQPTDNDMLFFVTELAFFAFDDHIDSQTSEIENIGKAYNAPDGKLYIQAVARGASNIAAGSEPRFQLQIQSFDPEFEGN